MTLADGVSIGIRADLLDTLRTTLEGLEGWCDLEKATRLAQLVIQHDVRVSVELGTYGGKSLAGILLGHYVRWGSLRALINKQQMNLVIGVDPYTVDAALMGTNDPANDDWWSQLDLKAIRAGMFRMLDQPPYNAVPFVLVERTSFDAVEVIRAPIDLLHQDSNHSEEVSCAEIDLWRPKLRPGGLWVQDDTAWASMQKVQQKMAAEGFETVEEHHNWKVWRVPGRD